MSLLRRRRCGRMAKEDQEEQEKEGKKEKEKKEGQMERMCAEDKEMLEKNGGSGIVEGRIEIVEGRMAGIEEE